MIISLVWGYTNIDMVIKAIIGIGNPGPKYEQTFHNAGMVVANKIEKLAQESLPGVQFLYSDKFMNQSGPAVKDLLKNKNFDIQNCIICHDDSDLSLGTFKLSRDRSGAGHRGAESIIASFGTQDFWRLRIGIRNPKEKIRQKAEDFVLKHFGFFANRAFSKVAEQALVEIERIVG